MMRLDCLAHVYGVDEDSVKWATRGEDLAPVGAPSRRSPVTNAVYTRDGRSQLPAGNGKRPRAGAADEDKRR
jgi:hypothetical protein